MAYKQTLIHCSAFLSDEKLAYLQSCLAALWSLVKTNLTWVVPIL